MSNPSQYSQAESSNSSLTLSSEEGHMNAFPKDEGKYNSSYRKVEYQKFKKKSFTLPKGNSKSDREHESSYQESALNINNQETTRSRDDLNKTLEQENSLKFSLGIDPSLF